MDDLPRGPALLALARDVLVNDLIPLLPQGRRLDALLVANCMAIAAREAEMDRSDDAVFRELDLLRRPLTPTLSPPGRERGGPAEREGAGPVRDSGSVESLRRFARELRIGAFENSPEREALARGILWRTTTARLRLANPRFLAANGFA